MTHVVCLCTSRGISVYVCVLWVDYRTLLIPIFSVLVPLFVALVCFSKNKEISDIWVSDRKTPVVIIYVSQS